MRILRPTDVAWTAGFLEGEGCFSLGYKVGGISISVPQVNPAPLRRLQNFFGGSINQKANNGGFNSQPIFVWLLCGQEAAELCTAVYPWMSEKRQTAIEAMIQKRRNAPGRGGHRKFAAYCARGHRNWGVYPTTKYRFCHTCANESKKKSRERARKSESIG